MEQVYTFKRQKDYITENGGKRVEESDLGRAHSKAERMSAVFKAVVCVYQGHKMVALYDKGIKRFG